jgi:hypothetical protein
VGLRTASALDEAQAAQILCYRGEKAERAAKNLAATFRISWRIALAELVGRYIKGRDAKRAISKK